VQWPAIPSRESYLALLDAFETVYQKRRTHASPHVWSYFGNLDGYLSGVQLSETDADQRHQALLDQIARQRQALRARDPWHPPGHVGRCFSLAVREEGVASTELDHSLAMYWPTLWGLAARGHWIRRQQPVRAPGSETPDLLHESALPPPMTLGAFRLSFTPYGGPEFATSICMDGPRQPTVMLAHYPELMEFHAMLERPLERPWIGKYFRALTAKEEPGLRILWLKRLEVAFQFSEADWEALRSLVGQAWQHPELQRWLVELRQQYGEQG
jgi:hypothetical protein